MSSSLYGIYGASGYGREVMPLARAVLAEEGIPFGRLVFIDDDSESESVNGHSVLSYDEFRSCSATKRFVALAIANSAIREKLALKCLHDRIDPWALSAANAVILDDVHLGAGAILNPFVTLTSNIRIGRHFHANLYSYVAHDCVIGDFVTFAPGVKCNGNVHIEDHAYLGTGAVIRQGRPGKPLVIGRGAVIGMGAVVTRDVPAGVTVVGNPAKPLIKD